MLVTVASTMAVIEYICNLEGGVSNDKNNTPLMYGVEQTSKSETEGLYFVLTHKENINEAYWYIKDDFQKIYSASDKYKEVTDVNEGFKTPHVGSYKSASDEIAGKFVAGVDTQQQDQTKDKS